MKIIVNKMPNNPDECTWAEWHPNPPFIEECGFYKCTQTNQRCNLHKNEDECYALQSLAFALKNK